MTKPAEYVQNGSSVRVCGSEKTNTEASPIAVGSLNEPSYVKMKFGAYPGSAPKHSKEHGLNDRHEHRGP